MVDLFINVADRISALELPFDNGVCLSVENIIQLAEQSSLSSCCSSRERQALYGFCKWYCTSKQGESCLHLLKTKADLYVSTPRLLFHVLHKEDLELNSCQRLSLDLLLDATLCVTSEKHSHFQTDVEKEQGKKYVKQFRKCAATNFSLYCRTFDAFPDKHSEEMELEWERFKWLTLWKYDNFEYGRPNMGITAKKAYQIANCWRKHYTKDGLRTKKGGRSPSWVQTSRLMNNTFKWSRVGPREGSLLYRIAATKFKNEKQLESFFRKKKKKKSSSNNNHNNKRE